MNTLLVDSNSLFARSWYAAQKIGPNPEQTLRLAAVTILNLLNPVQSEIGVTFNRTLFCWDSDEPNAKNRELKPPEYYVMRDIAKDLFTLLLGTTNAVVKPFEGDDLVASAVYRSKPGTNTIIASGDKDLMQLVDAERGIAYYSLNDKCILSEYSVCAKFHVKKPCQIALALAIQGDSVDSIPGVRGWGKVKVKNLFKPVGKDMTFDEVIDILEATMTTGQQDEFYASLERTLLNTSVKLPDPAPLVFAEDEAVAPLEMPEILNRLREVRFLYDENSGHDFA